MLVISFQSQYFDIGLLQLDSNSSLPLKETVSSCILRRIYSNSDHIFDLSLFFDPDHDDTNRSRN